MLLGTRGSARSSAPRTTAGGGRAGCARGEWCARHSVAPARTARGSAWLSSIVFAPRAPQVCAYALRQSALEEELAAGVDSSPFVRALLLADGTVSVLDARGVALQRIWWCVRPRPWPAEPRPALPASPSAGPALPAPPRSAYELYVSLLRRGPAFRHDVYHALPLGAVGRRGRAVEAVGLVDGFASDDEADNEYKAKREGAFPRELLQRTAAEFDASRAEASQPSDRAAILRALGQETAALNCTVRARCHAVMLAALLRVGADQAELRAALQQLAGSSLRKLSLFCEDSDGQSAASVELLMGSLPRSLQELRAEKLGQAAVCAPLLAALSSGQLRSLELRLCGLQAGQAGQLAAALSAEGCLLTELDLTCVGAALAGLQGRGSGQQAGRGALPRLHTSSAQGRAGPGPARPLPVARPGGGPAGDGGGRGGADRRLGGRAR